MNPLATFDPYPHVSDYARHVLQAAGVGDCLPTPVDDIVACAGLRLCREVSFEEKLVEYQTAQPDILRRALSKTLGVVDLREDVVYLDQSVLPQKQAFLKLHEAGHKVLPWQRGIYLFLDDATTLDPDVRTCFEREANHFAASVFFQLERFDREVSDLPLSLRSALGLVRRYGASAHATIRRFVERNHRSCALLILELPATVDMHGPTFAIKRVIQSPRFTACHRAVAWPNHVDEGYPFVRALLRRTKFSEGDGVAFFDERGKRFACGWQLFNSTYNAFILLQPLGSQA